MTDWTYTTTHFSVLTDWDVWLYVILKYGVLPGCLLFSGTLYLWVLIDATRCWWKGLPPFDR